MAVIMLIILVPPSRADQIHHLPIASPQCLDLSQLPKLFGCPEYSRSGDFIFKKRMASNVMGIIFPKCPDTLSDALRLEVAKIAKKNRTFSSSKVELLSILQGYNPNMTKLINCNTHIRLPKIWLYLRE